MSLRLTGANSGQSRLFILSAAAFALFAACARMGAPMGGPEDKTPPRVESVVPAADSTGVSRGARITLLFSENVQRQAAERLISLSPWRGRLYFDWSGRAVAVRPSDSLRADITYRIAVDKGLTDLHRVKSDTAFASYFSTGSRFSPGRVAGSVYFSDSLVAGAIVLATPGADTSLVFESRSDSSGRYVLPYLPFGDYRLRAFRDLNRNNRFDFTRDEGADSLVRLAAEPLQVDFHLVLGDTTAPVLMTIGVTDSVTLALAFDDRLDSLGALDSAAFELRTPDSSGAALAVESSRLDSLDRRRVNLRLAAPLVREQRYWLRAADVKNAAGLMLSPGRGSRIFTWKKEGPPPAGVAPSGARTR